MSSTVRLPRVVHSRLVRLPCVLYSCLSLCHPPPHHFAKCPLPPSSFCVVCRPIALHCLPSTCLSSLPCLLSRCLPPACLASSTSPSRHVIHCPLTPHILYLNLIVAFPLSLFPPPDHHPVKWSFAIIKSTRVLRIVATSPLEKVKNKGLSPRKCNLNMPPLLPYSVPYVPV